jgi:hypothetical protein
VPTGYPITVQTCAEVAAYEVGGKPAGPLETRELVDQAGHFLVGMTAWRWLEGRQARLRTRTQIDLTGATWTEATKTLTKAGAFTDYTWLEGDTLDDVSGTGATDGTYEVASRVDANSITLATSIGAAANGQTDIAATLPNDQVALPSDFDIQRITAWGVVGGLAGALSLSSGQDLLDLRWTRGRWTCSFWGLLNHVRSLADGRTIPRLDIGPGVLDGTEQLVIFYRAGWATPEDDGSPLPLPKSGWLNSLFLEVLKAFAMSQEESEKGSLMQRLALVKAGPLFADAYGRDQTLQAQAGNIGNGGWMEPYSGWGRSGGWFDRGTILGTSV